MLGLCVNSVCAPATICLSLWQFESKSRVIASFTGSFLLWMLNLLWEEASLVANSVPGGELCSEGQYYFFIPLLFFLPLKLFLFETCGHRRIPTEKRKHAVDSTLIKFPWARHIFEIGFEMYLRSAFHPNTATLNGKSWPNQGYDFIFPTVVSFHVDTSGPAILRKTIWCWWHVKFRWRAGSKR